MTVAFITHPACMRHEMGPWHPESPDRLAAVRDHLLATGLLEVLAEHEAPEVTREQLLRIHPDRYLDWLERAHPREGYAPLDPDTLLNPHSLAAARRAAGAVVYATDLVATGRADSAFCAVRPPGHHAERARAMGFCVYNNVAVGAAHALAHHGLERVAIVDFDVHHGNGTEEMFGGDARVLMVSIFQHPFYPFSGTHAPAPNMVNVPLPAGSAGAALRRAVEDRWLPALEAFRPRMLFVSAGFDAHRDDDMAGLAFVEDDYAWVTRELMAVAARHAGGRVVSTLEGGYNLVALARSAAAHVRALVEGAPVSRREDRECDGAGSCAPVR